MAPQTAATVCHSQFSPMRLDKSIRDWESRCGSHLAGNTGGVQQKPTMAGNRGATLVVKRRTSYRQGTYPAKRQAPLSAKGHVPVAHTARCRDSAGRALIGPSPSLTALTTPITLDGWLCCYSQLSRLGWPANLLPSAHPMPAQSSRVPNGHQIILCSRGLIHIRSSCPRVSALWSETSEPGRDPSKPPQGLDWLLMRATADSPLVEPLRR